MAAKKTSKKTTKKTTRNPDKKKVPGKKPVMPTRLQPPTPQRIKNLTVASKNERPRTVIDESRKERRRLIKTSTIPNAGSLDVCPIHNKNHVKPVYFENLERKVYQCMSCGLVLGDAVLATTTSKPIEPKVGSD